VLVVDDESDLCLLYETTLKRAGYDIYIAEGVQSAKKILVQHPDIVCVVSDFRMNDGTGLDLLRYLSQAHIGLPICLVTAYSSPEQSVQALKEGAFDYLSKPVSVADLRRVVAAMVEQNKAYQTHSPQTLLAHIEQRLPGQSTAMKAVHQTLVQLAQTDACVVIQGEAGTGKELAARALHAASIRATQPFIVLDCSLLQDSKAAERALFGEYGVKQGVFQATQGGTLLLDEVSCLPIDIQIALLNVLQTKTISKITPEAITETNHQISNQTQRIDVRILISTTTALSHSVAMGKLRQDLYYRLNIMALHMPPLRDRSGDAPWLAQRWLLNHVQGKTMSLSMGAIAWLRSHIFSGNIRELNNIIERGVAVCMAQGEQCIEVIHLQRNDEINRLSQTSSESNIASNFTKNQITKINFPMDLTAHLGAIERQIIEQALQYTRYNRTQAAVLLGINVRQIRYRIEQLGIEC
ncbi:MAG: type 4 fimbriae expression regulatory protein, partial [Pseudomonadota bacterium]